MPPIMITKLLPPRIGSELIERSRLLEWFFHNKDCKLIVVVAPAGYGKTIATLQYVSSLQTPFIWYQLDQYDNDPAVFIQYLIAGIERYFSGFGSEILQLLQSNSAASLRLLVISFINVLTSLSNPNLVIVLDDYHLISDPAIHQFLQELLPNLPAGIQILITSRRTIPLNLTRLQVAGEMALIDSTALRFTDKEASEFLTVGKLSSSEDVIGSLIAKIDGWPAAFKLLTLSAVSNELTMGLKETEQIYNYLANEVLDQQPEEIRNFLISSAVLETLTPEKCDLLLERQDSQQLLDLIEKKQLFLILLTGQGKTYRYHQLFRQFLLERLGSAKKRLLHKAGEIAERNGDWDQAVDYYSAAERSDRLIPLLEKAGREALRQGRWQTVAHWLGLLNREQIGAGEWLSLFQAKIDLYRGKLGDAEGWIAKSMAVFKSRKDAAGIGECQFLQAKIFNRNGRYQESLDLLAEAYPVLQQSESLLRFELSLEKALIFIHMGRLRQAETLLLKGLQVVTKQDDSWITAHFMEGLGNTYYMLGETAKGLEYYQKAARLAPDGILPGYCADFTGFLYQELGHLDQAFEYLQKEIALKEKLGMNEALLPAYYQLSSIYTDIGELEKAEAIYQKAIRLINEIDGERFFSILLKVNLGRIRALQGQLVEAQVILKQILAESQQESGVALLMCRLFYSLAILMSGNLSEAEQALLEALEEEIEFAQALTYGYFMLTSTKFAAGDLTGAAEYAAKLLNYAASKNFEQMFVFMFDNLQPILQFGLENEVEVPFIQRVLVLLGERGFALLKELASHPDSSVRARIIFPLSQINSLLASELLQTLATDLEPKIRSLVKQCAVMGSSSFKATQPKANVEEVVNHNVEITIPAPILQIRMLGPARIIFNNTDITGNKWRFTKSRDLLFYLAHQGQPVGINRILEDLWPDVPLEKGMNFFYSTLHWLRRVIQSDSQQEPVIYASKTCQLIPAFYTTDRDRFLALLAAGSFEDQVNENNLALLEEAVALYRGDYLDTLDYPWIAALSEHLNRLYLETCIRLGRYYLQIENYLKTVKTLEPLLAQNPLREELFGILMSAYAGLGDRLAVIRQYQQLKSNLDHELGVLPASEITKLYYQLCGSNGSARSRLRNA